MLLGGGGCAVGGGVRKREVIVLLSLRDAYGKRAQVRVCEVCAGVRDAQ